MASGIVGEPSTYNGETSLERGKIFRQQAKYQWDELIEAEVHPTKANGSRERREAETTRHPKTTRKRRGFREILKVTDKSFPWLNEFAYSAYIPRVPKR